MRSDGTASIHVSDEVRKELAAGKPQEVIVEFRAIEEAFADLVEEHPELARTKSQKDRLATISKALMSEMSSFQAELVRGYQRLPYAVVKVDSVKALERLAQSRSVAAVWENEGFKPASSSSTVPAGSATGPMSWGQGDNAGAGTGATVAIIDTGLDFAADQRSVGSVTIDGAGLADGDAVAIDEDGAGAAAAVTFEFDSTPSGVASGAIAVAISGTAAGTATNLAAAINASSLPVVATVSGATVSVQHDTLGAKTGLVTETTDTNTLLTVVDFSTPGATGAFGACQVDTTNVGICDGTTGGDPFGTPCAVDADCVAGSCLSALNGNTRSVQNLTSGGSNYTAKLTPVTGCQVSQLWEIGTNDNQLDTASDGSPALNGAGHGTQVAAVINAVAPGAEIIAFDAARANNPSTLLATEVLAALDVIYDMDLSGARDIAAVNVSMTTSGGQENCTTTLTTAIAQLRTQGIAFVAPAGDVISPAIGSSTNLATPACATGAVSVGSLNAAGTLAMDTANTAGFMTLYAPGEGIDLSGSGTAFPTVAGSSFAAAHVTGALAVTRGLFSDEGAAGDESDDVDFAVKRLTETSNSTISDRESAGAAGSRPKLMLSRAVNANFCTLLLSDDADNRATLPVAAGAGEQYTVQFNKDGCTLDVQAPTPVPQYGNSADFADYDFEGGAAVQVSTSLTQTVVAGRSGLLTFHSRAYVGRQSDRRGDVRVGADDVFLAGTLQHYTTLEVRQTGDTTKPVIGGTMELLGAPAPGTLFCSNDPSVGTADYVTCTGAGYKAFVKATDTGNVVYLKLDTISATDEGNISWCLTNGQTCTYTDTGSPSLAAGTLAASHPHAVLPADGVKNVTLLIKDAAGNIDSTELKLSFNVDSADPAFARSNITVEDGALSVNLSWTNATDAATIAGYELWDITGATISANADQACLDARAAEGTTTTKLGDSASSGTTGLPTGTITAPATTVGVDHTLDAKTIVLADGVFPAHTFELDCDGSAGTDTDYYHVVNIAPASGSCLPSQASATIDLSAMTGDDFVDDESLTLVDGVNALEFGFNLDGDGFGDVIVDINENVQEVWELVVNQDHSPSNRLDGETFQLNGTTYELDDNSSFTGGNTQVSIPTSYLATEIAARIVQTVSDGAVTDVVKSGAANTVVFTAVANGDGTASEPMTSSAAFTVTEITTGSTADTPQAISNKLTAAINGSTLGITADNGGNTSTEVTLTVDAVGSLGNQVQTVNVASANFVWAPLSGADRVTSGGDGSGNDLATYIASAIDAVRASLPTTSVISAISYLAGTANEREVSLENAIDSANGNIAISGTASPTLTFAGMSGGAASLSGRTFTLDNTLATTNITQGVPVEFLVCAVDAAGRTTGVRATGFPRQDVQEPYIYNASLLTNDVAQLTGLNCGGSGVSTLDTCGYKGCTGATAGTTAGAACDPTAADALDGVYGPGAGDYLRCPAYDSAGNQLSVNTGDCTVNYAHTQTTRALGLLKIAPPDTTTYPVLPKVCNPFSDAALLDVGGGGDGIIDCTFTGDAACGDGGPRDTCGEGFCVQASEAYLLDVGAGGAGYVSCDRATEALCGTVKGTGPTCDVLIANPDDATYLPGFEGKTCNTSSGPAYYMHDCVTDAHCGGTVSGPATRCTDTDLRVCNDQSGTNENKPCSVSRSATDCGADGRCTVIVDGNGRTSLDGQYFEVDGMTFEFDANPVTNSTGQVLDNVLPGHIAIPVTSTMDLSDIAEAALTTVNEQLSFRNGVSIGVEGFLLWFPTMEQTLFTAVKAFGHIAETYYHAGRLQVVSTNIRGLEGNDITLSTNGSRLSAVTGFQCDAGSPLNAGEPCTPSTALQVCGNASMCATPTGKLFAGSSPTYYPRGDTVRMTLSYVDQDSDRLDVFQVANDVTQMCMSRQSDGCSYNRETDTYTGTWINVTNGPNILGSEANGFPSYCSAVGGVPIPPMAADSTGTSLLTPNNVAYGVHVADCSTSGGAATALTGLPIFRQYILGLIGAGVLDGLIGDWDTAQFCANGAAAAIMPCDEGNNTAAGLNAGCADTFMGSSCQNAQGIYKSFTMPADQLFLGNPPEADVEYFVRVIDRALNVSPAYVLKVHKDQTPPVNGNFSIVQGAGYNVLSFASTDTGSGLKGYKIVSSTAADPADCSGTALSGFDYDSTTLPLDTTGSSPFGATATNRMPLVQGGSVLDYGVDVGPAVGPPAGTLADVYAGLGVGQEGNGTHTRTSYRVCVQDKAGNVSTGMLASAEIKSNLTPPIASNVLISGGNAFTNLIAPGVEFFAHEPNGDAVEYCAIAYGSGESPKLVNCNWKSTLQGTTASACPGGGENMGAPGCPGAATTMSMAAPTGPSEWNNKAHVQVPNPNGIKDVGIWLRDEWGNISDADPITDGNQHASDLLNTDNFPNPIYGYNGAPSTGTPRNSGGGIGLDRTAPPTGTATAVKAGSSIRISWSGNTEAKNLNPNNTELPINVGMPGLSGGYSNFKVYARVGSQPPGLNVCKGLTNNAEPECSAGSVANCYVCSGGASATNCNFTTPVAGTTYSFRICAQDANQNYNYGDTISNNDPDESSDGIGTSHDPVTF